MRRGGPFALALPFVAAAARADLPPEGQPIRVHDYAIDLAQTPVLASTRVTGLAGAFVAIGEGVEGSAQNPAAVALRWPYSTDHFDYDLGLGITFSSNFNNSDVFNSGRNTLGNEQLIFYNLALNLQFGRWGLGVSSEIQEYGLSRTADRDEGERRDRLTATFLVNHTLLGHAFHEGQVLVGLGSRSLALNVNNENAPGGEQDLFSATASGFEAGVLIRPNDAQYRLGVTVRSAVTAEASGGEILYAGDPENELYLPDRVALPWEIHAGVALQFGPRPFNPRWLDPTKEIERLERYLEWRARERARRRAALLARARADGLDVGAAARAVDSELETEAALDELHLERATAELDQRLRARYAGMRRFYALVSASLDVLGPTEEAVGIESFLDRRVQRSGPRATFSPRLGLETEAVPGWTRLRVGNYIEPSRFPENPKTTRAHWTFGVDQRLFAWELFGVLPEGSIFRTSGSLDLSRDYFSWSLAAGMWH